MNHLFNSLLFLLIRDAGHVTLASQTLPRRVQDPSVPALLDSPTPRALTQAYNSSQATSSVSAFGIPSHTTIDVPTPLPSPFQAGFIDSKNYQDIISGNCAINDNYCSFEGSRGIANSSTKGLIDQCLLWDTSCSGNRTSAIDKFFNTTDELLQANSCFSQFSSGVLPGNPDISVPAVDPGTGMVISNMVIPSDCKKYNSPERIAEWQDMKTWMRSPGCVSAQIEWMQRSGKGPPGLVNVPSEVIPSCCGLCDVGVTTVDIYYWPEPGVNTSCLDVVGTNVNPLAYGATTDPVLDQENGTYWACSLKTPATSTYTYPGTKAGAAETVTSVYSIVTTAELVNIGSLSVKIPRIDPWSSSPCIDAGASPQGSNGSNGSTELHVRHVIQARAHTLINQSVTPQSHASPESTVVLGELTLSVPPSIFYL